MALKTPFAVFSSLLAVTLFAQTTLHEPSRIGEDEYAVYAVMLAHFQQSKKASHPIVSDHTSTFACDKSCNGMNIGGCNGLRDADETPAERLAITRRDVPGLASTVTTDFEQKNQRCSKVERRIPSKFKYLLFGVRSADNVPADWDSPDYFYFSRVGFNQEHTQALVVVGFLSGSDARDSGGKYFFLAKQTTNWKLQGTSDIWQLTH
jgi:hypothetical protein